MFDILVDGFHFTIVFANLGEGHHWDMVKLTFPRSTSCGHGRFELRSFAFHIEYHYTTDPKDSKSYSK